MFKIKESNHCKEIEILPAQVLVGNLLLLILIDNPALDDFEVIELGFLGGRSTQALIAWETNK